MRRDSVGKMKTLDEVIIALEVCTLGYCSHPKHGDCPYLDERNDCDTRQRKLDALHYLREYQKILPLVPSLINTAIAVQKKGKTIG